MGDKEFLVLRANSNSYQFAVHLKFKDQTELNEVLDALKPLGYKFRYPKGR